MSFYEDHLPPEVRQPVIWWTEWTEIY